MHYDGDFQVAFRGPGAVMKRLPGIVGLQAEALSADRENGRARSELLELSRLLERKVEEIEETEEPVVVKGEYFSGEALAILEGLDAAAHAFPGMEIAVGAVVRSTAADSEDYVSYYSPAGSDTICESRSAAGEYEMESFLKGARRDFGERVPAWSFPAEADWVHFHEPVLRDCGDWNEDESDEEELEE